MSLADVYENEKFTATVYRISPTINPATQVIYC